MDEGESLSIDMSSSSGKPMSLKRGPGRPRKERCPSTSPSKKNIGLKLKRWKSSLYPRGSGTARGRGGRRRDTLGSASPRGESPSHMRHSDSLGMSLVDVLVDPLQTMPSTSEGDKSIVPPEDVPVCALCNLGERSQLGQGEILRLLTPEGFSPSKESGGQTPLIQRSSSPHSSPSSVSIEGEREVLEGSTSLGSGGDKSPRNGAVTARRQKNISRAKLLSLNANAEPVDELSLIGYVEEPDMNSIFERSGHFYVHQACALWTAGVTHVELLCPEKLVQLVVAAIGRKCVHCSHFGASLSCGVTPCTRAFHLPCVAASEAFQNAKLLSVLCIQHLDRNCRVCSDCGSRTPGSGHSSRWHAHFTVCDSCYQQRNKGLACPICRRAYRHVAHREMAQCGLCRKFVHGHCDPDAEMATYQKNKEVNRDYEYICPTCKSYTQGRSLKKKESTDDGVYESSLMNTSQESLYMAGDDVMPMDVDSGSLEKGMKDGSGSLDEAIPGQPMRTVGLGKGKPFCASKIAKKKLGIGGGGRPKGAGKVGGAGKGGGYQKKQRGVQEFGRKRGHKTKMRGIFGVPGVGLQRPQSDSSTSKTEDEPGVENRLVLCSANDQFVLLQDVCVMCGALGSDQEGCLISCAQCGQCYHPYCVNVKVTKIILQKGWRCLDCTVCEGCGQRNDEGRLILCDDCDISYHIYCMDPPLDYVPHGNWKCKCALCQMCGSNDPGFNCTWQNSYTECGPCASLSICPSCNEPYSEGELIIQCVQCERWLHGACDMIRTEAEAERCSAEGYNCILCRPRDVPPPHLLPPPPPPKPPTPTKSPEPPRLNSQAQFYMDGVCLSEMGLHQIKSLALEQQPRKKRKKVISLADTEAGILATIESVVAAGSTDASGEPSEGTCKMELDIDESSTHEAPPFPLKDGAIVTPRQDGRPPEAPEGFTIVTSENGVMILRKKRQRNLQKLGIGGFVARLRGTRKDKDDEAAVEGEGGTAAGGSGSAASTPTGTPASGTPGISTPDGKEDKPTKRKPQRRKPKNKLMESYPSYLQEAFFGKELLDTTKGCDVHSSSDSDEERVSPIHVSDDKTIKLSQDEIKAIEEVKAKQDKETDKTEKKVEPVETKEPVIKSPVKQEEDDEGDAEALKDILPIPGDLLDTELVNTIMNEDEDDITKTGENLEDIADSTLPDDAELNESLSISEGGPEGSRVSHKDELTDILSPHFNLESMVRDTGLPNMDSKDVEEIFKGVLTDESQESQEFPLCQMAAGNASNTVASATSPAVAAAPASHGIVSPSHASPAITRPAVGATPLPSVGQQQNLSSPISFPPPSPYHSEYSNSPQFSPAFSEPPSPWIPQQQEGSGGAGEGGTTEVPSSYNQRSNQKMEADESLGSGATISAVLYANINHPEWKKEYPVWSDRCKQILKKWRALPQDKKAPYLQKARENRAAARMKKSQQDQDKILQQQKSSREAEQERQWKQLQALRQQQAQQQQLNIQEQRVQ
ncbi:hypothetical protein J437_LFUL012796, partial [Ladona fulva]